MENTDKANASLICLTIMPTYNSKWAEPNAMRSNIPLNGAKQITQ